ncbi:MAG: DUF2949 domain-containing protein [Xenococcaceae cyanobacterium]|nr:DUF2949 domain-containing protein [Xenococcaceae cyanobacterium MO_188.B29]
MLLERLIKFMHSDLGISQEAIILAQKVENENPEPNILPMILWQYGLLNREQLDRVFDWLETV